MANSTDIASEERLFGLETEYAIRLAESDRRSHRDVFEALCRTIEDQLPTAPADPTMCAKIGIFLGTGGAIWFESLFPNQNVGLIEGATPECRTVRDLLACQQAQDRLLEEAAQRVGVSLIKNSHDGAGNVYGTQENYEVPLGSPRQLKYWRIGCCLLLIPAIAWCLVWAIAAWIVALASVPFTMLIHRLVSRRETSKEKIRESFDFWIGRCWRSGWNGLDLPCGGWIARPFLRIVQLAALPYFVALQLLLKLTDIPRIHHELTAFLVTRMLYGGAGRLDDDGHFRMADKGEAIDCVTGLPEYLRPVFAIGQFVRPGLTVIRFPELFAPRQRVQVSLGDSNMCEEAELLRIGTTRLMVDLVCASTNVVLPRLKRPVSALKQLSGDLALTRKFRLRDGTQATALEIQRMCRDACDTYVCQCRPEDKEALDILRRWTDVLNRLEKDPESLVGRIDWVTKRFLMEQASQQTEDNLHDNEVPVPPRLLAACKKIDIRYHELGPDGYFNAFARTELHERVLAEEEIEAAMRLPPAGTPATMRARLIREYHGTGVQVGWKKLSNGLRIE